MAQIASYVAPLVDPDLDELRGLATSLQIAVRVNTAAKFLGKPAIELYAKRPGNPQLAVFRHAAQGLEWLQAGRQASE